MCCRLTLPWTGHLWAWVYHDASSGNSCLATLQIFCSLPMGSIPPDLWQCELVFRLSLRHLCPYCCWSQSVRSSLMNFPHLFDFCLMLMGCCCNVTHGPLGRTRSLGFSLPSENCVLSDFWLMCMNMHFPSILHGTQLLCPTHIFSFIVPQFSVPVTAWTTSM